MIRTWGCVLAAVGFVVSDFLTHLIAAAESVEAAALPGVASSKFHFRLVALAGCVDFWLRVRKHKFICTARRASRRETGRDACVGDVGGSQKRREGAALQIKKDGGGKPASTLAPSDAGRSGAVPVRGVGG